MQIQGQPFLDVGSLGPPEKIRWAELFAGVSEVVTRIIEDAETETGRWLDLVAHVDTLPADDRGRP